jgi:hypothetical protein
MDDAYYKAMALADGELDPADLPDLVHKLERNGALMRAAQSFLDLRRSRLARLYARKADEPLPQSIVETIMTAPIGMPTKGAAGVFAFGGALFERVRQKYRMPGWSLAAGPAFAAAIAVAASWVLVPARGLEPTLTPQIEAALERAVGDNDPSVPGFKILLTYWSNKQSWCRQVDMASGGQQTSALACRQNNGRWQIVLQTPLMQTLPVMPGTSRPAGSHREVLDDYVRSQMNGPPLEREEVQNAINSGWERPAGK